MRGSIRVIEATMVPAVDFRFWASCAIVFVGSLVATVNACQSVSNGMPTPGGWTMSMAWMRMPLVWSILGLVLYPIGLLTAYVLMASPALARLVPSGSAAILILAGCVQLTGWKARVLCRCRSEGMSRSTKVDGGLEGWRVGIRMGMDCIVCCSSFMAVLIVTGVMNLLGMAFVTAAITAERLFDNPQFIRRIMGVGIILFALLHLNLVLQ